MTTKPHTVAEDNEILFSFKPSRDIWSGSVSIPAHVYEVWMPLLGARAIGVYAAYYWLGRMEITVINIERLAAWMRVGRFALRDINSLLAECGFISIDASNEYRITITPLVPPRAIPATLREEYPDAIPLRDLA